MATGTDYKLRMEISAEGTKATAAFKNVDEAIARITKRASVFTEVLSANVVADALQRIAGKFTEGASAVFNYASKLEQSKVSFTNLMKSADLATAHIAELEKLSRATPLKFESISNMSARLQGAGIEAAKIIPLIKDIGNVAAATGELSAERMEGLGNAFAQIASKGRVSAEEMEQLAERGVPAWRILSEAIGETLAVTRKMAEDGKISSDQLFAAFQKFSQVNFGNAMEKQAATFSGAMGQISNIALQTANEAFKPIYEEISKFSSRIAKSLKDQESAAKASGVSFGFAIGEAIGDGVARSKIGQDSWWITLLFPWKAILQAAGNLGQDIGKGIVKGYQETEAVSQIIPNRPTYDPNRPNDMSYLNTAPKLGPLTYDTTANAKAKEESEKADKERRDAQKKAFDRDVAALKENLKLQISAQSEATDLTQDAWAKQFEDKKITEDRWREISESNFKIYAAKIKEILRAAYKVDSQGKTPLELENLRLGQVAAIQAIDGQIVRMREDREKKITGAAQKEQEQQEQIAKQTVDQLRAAYESNVADFDSGQRKKLALSREYAVKNNISEENQARFAEKLEADSLANRLAALKQFSKEQADTQAAQLADLKQYAAGLADNTPAKQTALQAVADLENEINATRKTALQDIAHLEDEIEATRADNAANEHLRQQAAIEDLRQLQRMEAELHAQLLDFRAEQERKRFVNVIETGSNEALFAEMASLRDFQIAEVDRRFRARQAERDDERDAAVQRVQNHADAVERIAAIDAAYRAEQLTAENAYRSEIAAIAASGKEEKNPRIAALIALRDFDLRETARQQAQRAAELAAEKAAALERVKGKDNEEAQKFAIEELFKQKTLISDEEFEARRKAIRDGSGQDVDQENRQDTLNRTVGSGQTVSAMGQLLDKFSERGNAAAIAGIEVLTSAFSGLGQAIGEVVSAWVLYGSAGQSVRQVTAQILAGIAQQAAVKAVFELAEGFAALALAFFGMPNAGPSATAHFTAAAIYGGIAGIAAVAGRAVAGDSFKQQTANGGAGATASSGNRSTSGGQVYSSQEDQIVQSGINDPGNRFAQPSNVTNNNTTINNNNQNMSSRLFKSEIVLKIKSSKDHIVEVVRENVANNGTLRTVIQDAG